MLRRPDAHAGGISVTFTTAKARKSDRRAPGSKSAAADESDDAKLSTMARKACEAEAAAPFDPSPAATATATTTTKVSASAASSSSSSSHSLLASAASSIGVYAGFYWWILVITAGIGPTLWSTMALAFRLGDCPAAWLCLAASGVYWIIMTKVVPCDPEHPPLWAARLAAYVLDRTVSFFAGFDVVLDEGAAEAMESFEKGPFVVGLEPHSTLPMAAVLAFARFSPLAGSLPPALRGARLLASNACFAAPLVRHAWSWLGFAPASRRTMASLLATGTIDGGGRRRKGSSPTTINGGGETSPPAAAPPPTVTKRAGASVVLCPGGIREVLHLCRDRETVFLRSRRGFVRQALRAGAPLVPAFAFGQTGAFDWFPVLPSPPLPRALVASLCRSIGFAPLWIHNGWLVPFPKRSAAMTLVIGKPLEFVPRRGRGREGRRRSEDEASATTAAVEEEKATDGAPSSSLPSATFEVVGTKNSNSGKKRGLFRLRRGGSKTLLISSSSTSISSSSSSSLSSLSLSSSSSSSSEAETDAASPASASADDNSDKSSSSIPEFDEEDVSRYLAEFVEAMRSLYERHAPALGCADVPLTIL